MFLRAMVRENDGGLPRIMRAGDGFIGNPRVTAQATDSNQTITLDAIMGGVYQRTGQTADRTDTTPTAAAILAANPSMDIGDAFMFCVSNIDASHAVILAGGTGVTASGNLTTLLATARFFLLTKTSATTMTLVGL